jgi:hypothetical protein
MLAPRIDYDHYVEELLEPQDVHVVRASVDRAASIFAGLVGSVIMTILHALLIYVAVTGVLPIAIPVFIHIVVSVVLLAWSIGQLRAGADAPFITLLAVTTTFTGIFGAIGSFLSIFLYGIFRQKSTPFQECFSLIFPADNFTKPEEIYNDIVVGIDEHPRDYDVGSFLDVMELGSEIQKRRALSKIMIRFHPRLAPAVQRGLRDDSNAIRVQSATCVAKIEKEFMHKLEMVQKARKKFPDNLYVLYALAKYYDDYAYTGLLDAERELINREKAIETYKAYLEKDPNHSDAWLAIGRLLFRSGKWKEASDWFQNAMQRGWLMRPMLLWHLECLYHLKDFDALRKIAREHAAELENENDLPEALRDCVALWAKQPKTK